MTRNKEPGKRIRKSLELRQEVYNDLQELKRKLQAFSDTETIGRAIRFHLAVMTHAKEGSVVQIENKDGSTAQVLIY